MFAAVAGAVQPPHVPRRPFGGEGVEHCEYRGDADAGAQQDDGARILPERETAAWRTELHGSAVHQLVGDVAAGGGGGVRPGAGGGGGGGGGGRARKSA